MPDTQQNYRCAYCGSLQHWDGVGTAVCTQCGAAQPAKTVTASAATAKLKTVLAPVTLGCLVVVGLTLFFVFHRSAPPPATAPIIKGTAGAPTTSPVPGSRIIRVDNPHVRLIPAGVDFKPEDIVSTPEGTSSLPTFDINSLEVHTPRRVLDEVGQPAFLGEVINNSPNMVAVAPTVTLILTRGGKEVDKATRSFGDLLPGAHVPLFFRYSGAAKVFDNITLQWKPTQAYALGDPKHPRLVTTVLSQKQMTADEAIGHRSPYHYTCVRVTGKVVNEGARQARDVSIYVVLRDAKGQITGFDHSSTMLLSPGESSTINLTPTVMGEPATSVELVALPISSPSI